MKKLVSFLIALIIIVPLPGCVVEVKNDNKNIIKREEIVSAEVLTIEDYFPFKGNLLMDYQGIGNEYAEQKTFIEFVEANRAQMKIMNPGTVIVKVMEYKNGELKEVFSEGEFYHIENLLNTNSNTERTVLKEPIEVGNKWVDSQGNEMEITGIDKDVTTPLGNYKALEVTTRYDEGRSLKEYYSKDIGLVAKIYNDGDFQVKTLLQDISEEKEKIDIMTFYPKKNDLNSVFTVQEIEFSTNDEVESILENLMKNPPSEELLPVISSGVTINSINLDRDTWTVQVDFSKELLNEMNAGASLELELLKSIVNTLGKFYDVEKVYITIEGTPYESGHIGLSENNYFTVDTIEIEENK